MLEGIALESSDHLPVGLQEVFKEFDVQIINEIDSNNKLIRFAGMTMLLNYQIVRAYSMDVKPEAVMSLFNFDVDNC